MESENGGAENAESGRGPRAARACAEKEAKTAAVADAKDVGSLHPRGEQGSGEKHRRDAGKG